MKRDTPKYIVEIARELRKQQTTTEAILWNYLKNRKLWGLKFRRQYAIGRYIADFYCIEERLAIDLDGKIHEINDRKEYDLIRQEEIESRNIVVLRFTNEEVKNNINEVIKKICSVESPLPSSGEGIKGWGLGSHG